MTDSQNATQILYIGTKAFPTGVPEMEAGRGIYAFSMNVHTGELLPLGLAAEAENTNFLAIHPTLDVIYAAADSETSGEMTGRVISYKNDGQSLQPLNALPCPKATHLSVHPGGKFLFTANFHSGTMSFFRLNPNGTLAAQEQLVEAERSGRRQSPNPSRQGSPHPHWIQADPQGRYVLACDLAEDRIYSFRHNASEDGLSIWQPNENQPFATVATGAGVRHGVFSPCGKMFFAINEIACTLDVFRYAPETGTLASIQTLPTLPAGYCGENKAAAVVAHPNGKFLYTSNRGADLITTFSVSPMNVSPDEGRVGVPLAAIQYTPSGGGFPRFMTLAPSGRFLLVLNKKSHNAAVFHIHPVTGVLTDTGHRAAVPWGVTAVFARTGRPLTSLPT